MTQPATPTTWVPLGPDILTAITGDEKVTPEMAVYCPVWNVNTAQCLYLVYGEEWPCQSCIADKCNKLTGASPGSQS